MKRALFFMALALSAASSVQAQMPKWCNPPVLFDWATHSQTMTIYVAPNTGDYYGSNGSYDANGDLREYTFGTWTYENPNVGFGSPLNSLYTRESNIIKVPNTCNDYYVIYATCKAVGTTAYVRYTKQHWQGSGNFWYDDNVQRYLDLTQVSGSGWCNLAISKQLPNKNRYLFISGTNGLGKYLIDNDKISFVSMVTSSSSNIYRGEEGELYESGSGYKYATGGYASTSEEKIGVITMDANGNYVSQQSYSGVGKVHGIEFVDNDHILFSSTSGIGLLTLSTSSVSYLSNTGSCRNAHIEKAIDGKYYTLGTSGSDLKLVELNPSTLTTTFTSYTYNSIIKSPADPNVHTLVDQVDNENYVTAEYRADLISKDDPSDIGTEPNGLSSNIWASDDIWNVRDSTSPPLVHQNPGYTGIGNVMKLRITNAGCVTSAPSHAKMYWTLGATGEAWPNAWTGTPLCAGQPNGGGELTTPYGTTTYASGLGFNIGALAPGQSQILESKWQPVDPAIYSCTGITLGLNPMICFLGRIVDAADPMYNETNGSISANVRNNNNIVTRNTTLVNLPGNFLRVIHGGGGVLVSNNLSEATAFNISIRNVPGSGGSGTPFSNLGDVTLQVSQNFYDSWRIGGGSTVGLRLIDPQSHTFRVTDIANATFNNVMIGASEVMSMQADFSLTAPTGIRDTYVFDISQTSLQDDQDHSSHCSYIVSITDEEDGGSDGGDGKKTATGIGSIAVAGNAAVTVTPNPAQDVLNLSITSTAKDVVTVEVFDIMGRTAVKSFRDYAVQQGTTSLQLPVSDLANGMYLVRITGTHISSYSKIEVRH